VQWLSAIRHTNVYIGSKPHFASLLDSSFSSVQQSATDDWQPHSLQNGTVPVVDLVFVPVLV